MQANSRHVNACGQDIDSHLLLVIVFTAILLCGKVHKSKKFRRKLVRKTLSTIFIFHPFPKFLGLCAAGHNLQIEWAVIKGVSDYANGSKNATGDRDWQPFASAMAASVVYNMFKYPDVLKHWPNYQKPGTTKGTEIQLDM